MPQRPCINCRRLHRNPSRCDDCQARYNSARGSSSARGYGYRWKLTRARVLAEHLALYGNHCQGWQREPHGAVDLTVDHVLPKARGGTDDRANLVVLCRACNSAKRDR